MSTWPAVHGLADGQPVNSDTINGPLFELAQRTNYLFSQLQGLLGDNPFESVLLAGVPLATDRLIPVPGDLVYLDAAAGVYRQAQASMSFLDEFISAQSAFAIGVLTSVTGSTGNVVSSGKITLADPDGTPWLLANLLQAGETFRPGQYYLSSTTPGKITAHPQGPLISVGVYVASVQQPTYGDYAVLNPQYRDTGESHVHRSFSLFDQPAGQYGMTGETPGDTVTVLGFSPSLVVPGDWQPRLTISGSWLAVNPAQYTCWLSTAAGTVRAASPAPADFNSTATPVYLHWTSSDPLEGSGMSRVYSFEVPFAVGTKGLVGVLENPNGLTPAAGIEWSTPYQAAADSPDERTWVFTAPTQTRGWSARRWRQYFQGTTTSGFSLILLGGPHMSQDARSWDDITVTCAELHEFALELPTAHQTTVIGATTYEYTLDGTFTAGHIPVILAADMLTTYDNLVSAILSADVAGITPVLDPDNSVFVVGTPAGTSVTHLGVAIAVVAPGAGNVTIGAATASLLVFDKDHHNLVVDYGTPYWGSAEYWQFAALNNGLQIMVIPWSQAGAPKIGDAVAVGDTWVCEISDQANGSNFYYAIGMQQSLNQLYPPVPVKAASFMQNGIELSEKSFNPLNPSIAIGQDTIHWYSNQYGHAPWPLDWVSLENPGLSNNQLEQRLHFVKATIGDTGYVTSLAPASGSPITVDRCGTGDPATVGDLQLGLDLSLITQAANLAGFQAIKGTQGGKFLTGPVVEMIQAGPGISITQSQGAPGGQGKVTISSTQSSQMYSGDFDDITLLNAKEAQIGMFSYIRLLGWTTGGTNVNTGFVGKFRVPHTLPNVPYRVIIYATVFGENSVPGSVNPVPLQAGLNFTYSILPDVFAIDQSLYPNTASLNLQNQLLTPASVLQAAVPFGDPGIQSPNPIYVGYDPILIHNDPTEGSDQPDQHAQILGSPFPNADDFPTFPSPQTLGVRPGSIVAVKFTRAPVASGAEYTAPLGFINVRWALVTL